MIVGGESPVGCFGSVESNASGSDNVPVSESSSDLNNIKRKSVPVEQHPPKRRKRGHRRSGKHKPSGTHIFVLILCMNTL